MIWTFFSFLYTHFFLFILVTIINQSDSVIGCGFSVHRVGVCIEKNPSIYISMQYICIHNAAAITTTKTKMHRNDIVCATGKNERRSVYAMCTRKYTNAEKSTIFFLSLAILCFCCCSCVGQKVNFSHVLVHNLILLLNILICDLVMKL